MNNNQYLVSICVPIYGVEKYIERCATSLFEQTYSNLEYIFVDDCSPDNSIELLQRMVENYESRKSQIRILHHKINRGLAAARNTAVDAATGMFVTHIDSDDWIETDFVEKLVERQLQTGADIVSGKILAHNQDCIIEYPEMEYRNKDEMMNQIVHLTLDHTLCKRLIRVSLYKDNGICAVDGCNIGEDHYTLPRLLYFANSYSKTDEAIYHYNCENDSSYSHSSEGNSFSWKHYCANNAAIDILVDFFREKKSEYLKDIEKVKIEYLHNSLWYTLKTGRKSAFINIANDIEANIKLAPYLGISEHHLLFMSHHFYLSKMKVLVLILFRKLTGNKKYIL